MGIRESIAAMAACTMAVFGLAITAAPAAMARPASQQVAISSNDGGWVNQCHYSHSNKDDPIVFPGQQGATHLHDYGGNATTNYNSTYTSMTQAGVATTCPNKLDTAAYWQPAILNNGVHVKDCTSLNSASPRCTDYYRQDDLSASYLTAHPVQAWPKGFKMIAGNSHATSLAQNPEMSGSGEIYYGCSDNSTGKLTAPPNCSTGILSIHIGFPDCWNGVNAQNNGGLFNAAPDTGAPAVDQTLRYPSGGVCPAGFTHTLPRLIERSEIPVGTSSAGVTLSSGPTYTLHGDFWNTWNQAELVKLVQQCLNVAVDCGNDPVK